MLLLHGREHQIQDLRQERDAWRQQTLLLTAGAKHEEPPSER
jgi:hypothetical protein